MGKTYSKYDYLLTSWNRLSGENYNRLSKKISLNGTSASSKLLSLIYSSTFCLILVRLIFNVSYISLTVRSVFNSEVRLCEMKLHFNTIP